MTQAIGTNFSVTLISTCLKVSSRGCGIRYVLSTRPENRAKLPISENGETRNGTGSIDGITYKYAWAIVDAEYVTYNVTLNSSFTVNLKSQYLHDCGSIVQIAFINFVGE